MSTLHLAYMLFLVACADPRGAFDDFSGRIVDAGADNTPDGRPLGTLPDLNGTFLMGVSAVVAPDAILQFKVETTFTDNGDGTGVVEMSLQPLDRETREPVGDIIQPDGPMTMQNDGRFDAMFTGAIVPGEANSISGARVVLDIMLVATAMSEDVFCGPANGRVISPTMFSIDGSMFAAIRIDPEATAEELPAAISVCPEEVPELDAGVPDAGIPDAGTPDAEPPSDAAPADV